MSRFFIQRPVLAWVIAIIIMLFGIVSIPRLPVSRYPDIAPTSVDIAATYPGASAKTVEDSVTQVIEQHMTGLDGLSYFASSSDQHGNASITLTFASGTNPDTAQVQVQNRLQQATPRLPQIVQRQGISVSERHRANVLDIAFVSEDGRMTAGDIDDYVASSILALLNRVQGVGSVHMYGSQHAMRIWLDAEKLNAYALTPADVTAAVQAQNTETSVGQLGGAPAVLGQQLNATITALGRLHTPEQFRDIVLRSNRGDGATLRLRDVARVELGQDDYRVSVRYNGKPASGMNIALARGANALATAQRVNDLLEKLRPRLPAGLKVVTDYDTTPYVRKSIGEVLKTLAEATLLVFLVLLLFLQNLRATLIPTIAVPVVLLGTLAVMAVVGLSVNMLTLFALVLAIGLLVDDAIVVVENVERLMSEEGLSPVEATGRSMDEITGVLLGVASVLAAVFIPMAFLQGSVGVIYRQFSITIVSAMVLSVIVAVVLTPALCATLLKPVGQRRHHRERGFFHWFNCKFDSASRHYLLGVRHILGRPIRYLLIYAALASVMAMQFLFLPSAFLPGEDQGYLLMLVQGPAGAARGRTLAVLDQVREYFRRHEPDAVAAFLEIAGYSLSGGGENSGFAFVQLKDWSERRSARLGVAAVQQRANRALSQIKDARVFAFAPPPVPELGDSDGFDFYLQDIYGQGHEALTAASNQLLSMASKDALLTGVRLNGLKDAPQLHIDIDSQKAASFGLSLNDVNDTLAAAWGGRYIDDFIDRGQVKRVIIQADAPFRMVPEDFSRWFVRNSHGDMVSAASFTHAHWESGSPQLGRYNGFSALGINGEAAPGVSSGDALKEVEKLVARLPPGFSAEFTGRSYEERAAAGQASVLYTLSVLVVFLWLAGLYESWSIPTVILLAMPLGIMGAVLATRLRGLESDIYFQVAMLTTLGLTSKNAILIVEFAKKNLESGVPVVDATLRAARDRLRPILMTSLAFGLGVVPLAVATGAGAGAQRAIGTGVFGGMLSGTFLGIFFIPLFFIAVQRLLHGLPENLPGAGTEKPGSFVELSKAAIH